MMNPYLIFIVVCAVIITAFGFQNCGRGFKVNPELYDHVSASLAASRCESGTVRNCPLAGGTNGMQSCGANEQWGSCLFDSCSENFYRSGNVCLPMVCSPQSEQACNILGGSGFQKCSANGSELSGCQASRCDAGFVLEGSYCTPVLCTPGGASPCDVSNGVGVKICNLDGKTYGACQLQSCLSGFYVSNGQCVAQVCSPNSISNCTTVSGLGQKTCNSSGSGYGACAVVLCQNGSTPDVNGNCPAMLCTPGASKNCEVSNGVGSQVCSENGLSWAGCTVSTCNSGYLKDGNVCRTATVCSPGSIMSCTAPNGVGQTTCGTDGLKWSNCQTVSCNSGYEYDPITLSCKVILTDQVVAINPDYPIDQTFYKKQILVNGLPIVGSANVSDQAFIKTKQILNGMMSGQPSLWPALTNPSAGFNRVVIIAKNEKTTDIPEYRYLRNDPNTDWDARARGFGGLWGNPITSAGEENILCLPEDPYHYANESILIHEFAHTIMNVGLRIWNSSFDGRITNSYNQAMSLKLWSNTYAATNTQEYFASVTQSWFDSNGNYGATRTGDGIHNDVWYRTLLKTYDIGASTILADVFTDTPYRWTPRCR